MQVAAESLELWAYWGCSGQQHLLLADSCCSPGSYEQPAAALVRLPCTALSCVRPLLLISPSGSAG